MMQDTLNSFFSQLEPAPWLCYVFPVLALGILVRCAVSLLTFRQEPEVWAWLTTPDGTHIPVTHWESLVGRGAGCDVQLGYPTISRTHAVLTRYDDGSWTISDAQSKSGVFVNGRQTALAALRFGDVITMGGVNFTLVPITKEQERIQAGTRTRAGRAVRQAPTLLLLTLFQLLAALQLILGGCDAALELTAFGGLIGLEWALYLGLRIFRRTGFEAETLAFFLCTMGLAVVSSSAPESLIKELLAVCAGVCVFLVVCWSLRDLERAKAVRYLAAVAGMGLLVFNLIFGVEKYGARNWIQLGGLSFQPSEFVKVCFIYVGASTLSRLMAKRNIILFIAYSAAICACLALMKDFGTAVIFFVAFLVIAFLRSGNFATIALALAATGFAGVLVLRFLPYARNRFEAWGHVWDYALTTGYSQTRSMMCIASGGLFGLGPGKGWLKYVAASDTDLVFAFVSEEWGLILAIFDGRVHRDPRVLCGALGPGGAQLLLYDRRVRRGDGDGHADDPQCVRHGGLPAADRRDVPVRVERRIEYGVRVGAAGLYQGGGYPAECVVRHPPAARRAGASARTGRRRRHSGRRGGGRRCGRRERLEP